MSSVFPERVRMPLGQATAEGGLTKRELLAGMALQGILSQPRVEFDNIANKTYAQGAVDAAVRYADMLLAELEATAP